MGSVVLQKGTHGAAKVDVLFRCYYEPRAVLARELVKYVQLEKTH